MDTNQLKEQASDKLHEWQETAGEIKDRAVDLSRRASYTAREFRAAADLYVHEYTWTTLAIVAVTAYALGLAAGRRRRSA